MKEDKLLNDTLLIMEENGTKEAYYYLKSKLCGISLTGQIYNFLYCLAALNGYKEEALKWMEEAIILNNIWYRPEVFMDEDLKILKENERFRDCMKLSEKRYMAAKKRTDTVLTWKQKNSDFLFVALHGNQDNMINSMEKWEFLNYHYGQVEYIQSKDIDSCDLYRWEDNSQLKTCIEKIPWDSYKERTLCGFSAGCNVILETLLDEDVRCERVILLGPVIPIFEIHREHLIKILGKIEVIIVCGLNDRDCLDMARELNSCLDKSKLILLEGVGHELPGGFSQIIKEAMEN